MFAKWFAIVLLVVLIGFALTYKSRETATDVRSAGVAAEQNLGIYARALARYAQANSTTTGVVIDTQLVLPAGYEKRPGLQGYIDSGNAYVFAISGGPYAPLAVLRQAGAPGRRVGVKSGAIAKDVTNTVVAGAIVPLPAGIPDGSAVYVAREALPPPPPPPAQPTGTQPPPLAPITVGGSPIAVVATPGLSSSPVGWPCCTTPGIPIPPQAPVQPPVNPPPVGISNFIIGIHGGYSPGEGPKPGSKTCTGPNFNTFVMWDASFGNPADSYTISMSRAGQTFTKTLTHSQVQCAVSCGGNGSLLTAAQAKALAPEINWTRLVYDTAIKNSAGGIVITDWFMPLSVTLDACNGFGCTRTTLNGNVLGIFSNGQIDCNNGGSYPATAHP